MTTLPLFSTNFTIRNYTNSFLEKDRTVYEKIVNGETPSYENTNDVYNRILTENIITGIETSKNSLNYQLEQSTFMLNQWDQISEINSRLLDMINTESDINGNLNENFTTNVLYELTNLTNILNSKFLGKIPLAGSFENNNATVNLAELSNISNDSSPDLSYYTGGSSYSIQIGDKIINIDSGANSAIQATVCAARMCIGVRNKNEISSAVDLLNNASIYLYPCVIENAASNVNVIREQKNFDSKNVAELSGYLKNIREDTIQSALFKLIEIDGILDTSNSTNTRYMARIQEQLKILDRV